MSKQCARCGTIQSSDNTLNCAKCGKILPSSRPVKSSLSGEPPAWMQLLESSLTKPMSGSTPRDHRMQVEGQEKTAELSLLENTPVSLEDEEIVADDLPTSPLSALVSPQIDARTPTTFDHIEESRDDEEVVDDLPTMPMSTTLPGALAEKRTSPSKAIGNGKVAHFDEIEKIFTRPIEAQRQRISTKVGSPVQMRNQAPQAPLEPLPGPVLQKPVRPDPAFQQQLSRAQELKQTPPVSIPVPLFVKPERKRRRLLVLLFVLLFVLLLAGFIAWAVLFQPFAVPEITKTTQPFQNVHLGISLQFPQQWKSAVREQNGTVAFYDANHTDQVNILVVATGGQGMDRVISKVASSLGLTGQKTGAARSFAGASWQQVQGNVQQNGATYIATLLVTMHSGRYYTIVQLAPSSTYLSEDQLVFSQIRSSFQFL